MLEPIGKTISNIEKKLNAYGDDLIQITFEDRSVLSITCQEGVSDKWVIKLELLIDFIKGDSQ